jgi:hypothetical protein
MGPVALSQVELTGFAGLTDLNLPPFTGDNQLTDVATSGDEFSTLEKDEAHLKSKAIRSAEANAQASNSSLSDEQSSRKTENDKF